MKILQHQDHQDMDAFVAVLPYVGVEEVKDVKNVLKKCIAELIGVLFLVLIGCGSCTTGHDLPNNFDVTRVALAFGITVATMAQSFGHVSGCHINPAVTAGLFVGRKIGLILSILYIVAQCLGGILGAALIKALIPVPGNLGQSGLASGVNAGQGFGIEFLITFVLVLVVFGAAADENNEVKGSAPLAIGLSITIGHLLAVPLTGAGMNPARTFGPAVIGSLWENHWVYWLGPILGGVCASIVYQMFLKAEPKPGKDDYNSAATKEENEALKQGSP